MNLGKLFILVFVLMCSQLALAVPDFKIEQSFGTLDIMSAHPDIMAYDSPGAILFFQVYNSSGFLVNNTDSACSIRFYNGTNGVHIINTDLDEYGLYDWSLEFNFSILHPGRYPYVVYCYTVDEAGFYRGNVIFTTTGENITWEGFLIGVVIILLPLAFGFMCLLLSFNLGEDHAVLRICLALLAIIMNFFTLWFGAMTLIKFLEWAEMVNGIVWYGWVIAIIFVILFFYFMIYIIKKSLESIHKKQMEKLQY